MDSVLDGFGIVPGTVVKTTILAIGVYVIFKIISFILYVRRINATYGKIHGPEKRHWLYGNFIEFPWDSHGRLMYFIKLAERFGDVGYYRLWLGPLKAAIVVMAPHTVKKVLKSSEPKSRGVSGGYRFLEPWLGEGLLISEGQKWARSRRLLTPGFHFDILKPYMKVYIEAADKLGNKIGKVSARGEKFEVFEAVSLCTLEIILRCAFSYNIDPQNAGNKNAYVTAVHDITTALNYRFRRPLLHLDFLWKLTSTGRNFQRVCDHVHEVADDIINKRRATLEGNVPSDRKYLDFLDILLTAQDENGVGMSHKDIRNEVDTFLFEGHDTTASAISWILFSLAEHPEYQIRVQKEVDEILEGRDSDDIQWNDLSKMDFLTMCIKEGMRLHCPVPMISRETSRDFDIGEFVIPKDTIVGINIWSLHHNPHVWGQDHMEFKPERFSKENCAKMDSYQFVPFSAGPRNCIGQNFAMNEEKVVIATILRRFTLRLDPDHVILRTNKAVMRSEHGIMMYATPRS